MNKNITNLSVTLASIVVIIAGIYTLKTFVVPLLLSVFVAILLKPFFEKLKQWHCPHWLALIVTLLTVLAVWLLLVSVIGSSVQSFLENIDKYRSKLSNIELQLLHNLQSFGIEGFSDLYNQYIDPQKLFTYITQGFNSISEVLTNTFLIVLLVLFILSEMDSIKDRFLNAYGIDSALHSKIIQISKSIKTYIVVKATTSFMTGVGIAIGLAILGVDYPLVWGIMAFALNFIPNIGSIIAAVAPMLLSLVQFGWSTFFITGLLFSVVNIVIGNIIEPRMLGKYQNLSPLVVILSLLFWGWMFGIIGMILSVPLTVIVKIFMENNPELKHIATLISDTPKK